MSASTIAVRPRIAVAGMGFAKAGENALPGESGES